EVEDSKTKLMKETPYELLEDDQKKKRGKNNEAKMTLYNSLSRKDATSNTTKEKVKSLALKATVTKDQTSDDSDSQGGSDEDVDEEE
nr:hypothetical protein [Tanacetum cinerariifolium]